MKTGNLINSLPSDIPEEVFHSLLETPDLLLERILSKGHRTPDGTWYDQERGEWVLLLKGRARLQFEGESEDTEMEPGDFIYIPAHKRHRVEWTDPEEMTVWLALHHS